MGMIRVSNDAESKIKELAEFSGCTITATVDAILESAGQRTQVVGKSDSHTDDLRKKLDEIEGWLKKRFDDIEADIDGFILTSTSGSPNNSSSPSHRGRGKRAYIPWETLQELFFEVVPDGYSAWLPGAEGAARASDLLSQGEFFTDGSIIFSDDVFGKKDWMRVDKRVASYLESRGIIME